MTTQACATSREPSVLGKASAAGEAIAEALQEHVFGLTSRTASFSQLMCCQSFEKVCTCFSGPFLHGYCPPAGLFCFSVFPTHAAL
jgi:hypothetical protein